MKRAKAGRLLLTGEATSQRQALLAAGYSESVARKPGQNALSADRCISEALKAEPELEASNLHKLSARALHDKLKAVKLSDVNLVAVAKVYEITGKVAHLQGKSGSELPSLQLEQGDSISWVERAVTLVKGAKVSPQVDIIQATPTDDDASS